MTLCRLIITIEQLWGRLSHELSMKDFSHPIKVKSIYRNKTSITYLMKICDSLSRCFPTRLRTWMGYIWEDEMWILGSNLVNFRSLIPGGHLGFWEKWEIISQACSNGQVVCPCQILSESDEPYRSYCKGIAETFISVTRRKFTLF